VLSVILSCDDLYAAADFFTDRLGWRLVFSTPPESDDPIAAVALGDATVLLGPALEAFLSPRSRDHRGAGVQIFVTLPASEDIEVLHRRHEAAGVVTKPLSHRPWGRRAFNAELFGYRFLFAEDSTAGADNGGGAEDDAAPRPSA
jgi:catechol 2,3-dioxygenase-like lactoylglutathione lyase family enzyme